MSEETEESDASQSSDASDDRMTWTNIYLSFALRRADRAKLDRHMRDKDSSLSMRLRETLADTLAEAGVELPAGDGDDQGHHHH
ncbi:hypothetical protein [Rhodococcoides yunnanense]|uniref:hypothetical protein n=1 Tax=Rhodococcoides yunnanense TaxID=278209 RepID=UPI0009345BF3|nr:hypothetical protein [Rhodococcus yunnanensis]